MTGADGTGLRRAGSERFQPETLLPQLESLPVVTGYCVALSGGADSVALLCALVALRPRLRKPLRALHVHHGLQRQADEWAAFCRELCAKLDVPLEVIEITVERRQRESLEMAARRQRYNALAARLGGDEALLTAHHLDDQAETLLLHLFRGAGVDGLAAMPPLRPFARGVLMRPLLDWSRAALTDFLHDRGQEWIDDPSNADTAFDRNYLRHAVLPVIEARWPAVRTSLARAAALQAEQRVIDDRLAESGLRCCYHFEQGALRLLAWRELPAEHRRLVLRRWLRLGKPRVLLSRERLLTLERTLVGGDSLEQQQGEALLYANRGRLNKSFRTLPDMPDTLRWRLDRPLHIADLGIVLEPSQLLRQFPSLSPNTDLRVTRRRGGEIIPIAGRGHRPLKKMLQEWRVPSPLRARLPLIWLGDVLICVPGYWVRSDAFPSKPAIYPSRVSR